MLEFPDLLHAIPMLRIDRDRTKLALTLAFAAGNSRYFVVLSSHSRERAEVCPQEPPAPGRFTPEPAAGDQLSLGGLLAKAEETKAPRSGRSRWSWLLKRVFRADLETCNRAMAAVQAVGGAGGVRSLWDTEPGRTCVRQPVRRCLRPGSLLQISPYPPDVRSLTIALKPPLGFPFGPVASVRAAQNCSSFGLGSALHGSPIKVVPMVTPKEGYLSLVGSF